jgi:iron complex outermembrane receptor protein
LNTTDLCRPARGRLASGAVALATLALLARPLLGQSPAPGSASEPAIRATTTDVVVTAPRMEIPLKENPAATTVVDQETIQKTKSKSIAADEVLKLVPGLKVDNQADGERVHLSIRGQGLLTERGVRGVKVLLDGLPLNDPTGFAPDLFDVDWATVKRVEVFRGPASALYGGGAAGGVLSITTRDGEKGREHVDGSIDLGSGSFWKATGEASGVEGPVSYRVSGSRMMGEGYREHTAYFGTNLYGKFRLDPGSTTHLTAIVAGTSYFNENAEGLNADQVLQNRRMPNPDALTFNEYQKTRRATFGLTGQTALAANQDLAYSLYYRSTQWVESVPSTVQHRTYESPGAFLQYSLHLGQGAVKHHLSAGADLDAQAIDDLRRPNLGGAAEGPEVVADQTIRQSGLGLYLLDRVDLGSRWGAMLGLRWDRMTNELDDNLRSNGVDRSGDVNFEKATGRVGITWNPSERLGLYASWGQGFLPPATEELANNPAALGGFNTGLVPATSHGEEVGARGTLVHQLTYDVALFRLETKNDFNRYRVPGRPLETFYGNLGNTTRYGVETLLGWFPVDPVTVQLAYTWSRFKYDDVKSLQGAFSGTFMSNAPEHQAYIDVELRPASGFVVGLSGELATRSYVDASNLVWAGGYTLAHARVGYGWKTRTYRAEASLSVRNLTGKEYIAFTEPDPDGNSYQPAPTRQVFAGARIWLW